MFLAPSRSDLGESPPTINLFGVYLGELAGKTPTEPKEIKQDPRQWLCIYSTAIEVAGGRNSTKVIVDGA